MAQFKESEHPRDSDGKFTEKGISKGTKLNTIGKRLKENISKYGGYTPRDYKNYGWARANNILNAGQNKDFTSKFAQAVNGYGAFPKTSSGEFMIPVSDIYGDSEGVNNTIVYCKGTIARPIITRIVKIDADNETEADLERRDLYDCERRGVQPENSAIFRFYYATDFKY